MPKFSISTNRKGRGSFSGIPLIGLYYFILLAIFGLSTVTTSMFVFLERDGRVKNQIPWYLRWLAMDINPKRLGRSLSQYKRQDDPRSTEHLLANGHVQTGIRDKSRDVATSLLSLLPRNNVENNHTSYQLQPQIEQRTEPLQEHTPQRQKEAECNTIR